MKLNYSSFLFPITEIEERCLDLEHVNEICLDLDECSFLIINGTVGHLAGLGHGTPTGVCESKQHKERGLTETFEA